MSGKSSAAVGDDDDRDQGQGYQHDQPEGASSERRGRASARGRGPGHHSYDGLYKCPSCGISYKQKCSLVRHMISCNDNPCNKPPPSLSPSPSRVRRAAKRVPIASPVLTPHSAGAKLSKAVEGCGDASLNKTVIEEDDELNDIIGSKQIDLDLSNYTFFSLFSGFF